MTVHSKTFKRGKCAIEETQQPKQIMNIKHSMTVPEGNSQDDFRGTLEQ